MAMKKATRSTEHDGDRIAELRAVVVQLKADGADTSAINDAVAELHSAEASLTAAPFTPDIVEPAEPVKES